MKTLLLVATFIASLCFVGCSSAPKMLRPVTASKPVPRVASVTIGMANIVNGFDDVTLRVTSDVNKMTVEIPPLQKADLPFGILFFQVVNSDGEVVGFFTTDATRTGTASKRKGEVLIVDDKSVIKQGVSTGR